MEAPAQTLQFRKSERVRIAMPVQVFVGADNDAPLECETLLVNLNGCGLRTAIAIPVRSTVRVKVGNDEVPGIVVTCIQATGANAFSVGVKFERPFFWPVPNPPADWIASPISKPSQPLAVPTKPSPGANVGSSSTSSAAFSDVKYGSYTPSTNTKEAVKEITEAVARATNIANRLDTLAQTLPTQLESRLKEAAEAAAKAAQDAAIAEVRQRIESELEQKAAGLKHEAAGEYVGAIDAKIDELKRQSEELRNSLHAEAEGLRAQLESQLKQVAPAVHVETVDRYSAEIDSKIAELRRQIEHAESSLASHAEQARTTQQDALASSARAVEERLSQAAAAAAQTFQEKIDSAAAVYSELQNVGPAEELLGRLAEAVRSADDLNREITARQAELRSLNEEIATKGNEVAATSARLEQVLAACKQAAEAGAVVQARQSEIDEKLRIAEAQQRALELAVESGVTALQREREVAVSSTEECRKSVEQISHAVVAARGVLAQLQNEAAQLRDNIASESRRAVDELLRSAAGLQMAAVDLEQQAIDSFAASVQSTLSENLAHFELHVTAAAQRFASGLQAAAFHAFHHPSDEPSVQLMEGSQQPEEVCRNAHNEIASETSEAVAQEN